MKTRSTNCWAGQPTNCRFPLGQTVITPNALAQLPSADIWRSLRRHQSGDWGNVDEHDRSANEDALVSGERLLSVYHSEGGVKFWIITEADRSATTVLMPEDY